MRRQDRLSKLNIMAQVRNVAAHGWVYSLYDGILRDLGVRISSPESSTRPTGTTGAETRLGSSGARGLFLDGMG